jgi:hypothetical protein
MGCCFSRGVSWTHFLRNNKRMSKPDVVPIMLDIDVFKIKLEGF